MFYFYSISIGWLRCVYFYSIYMYIEWLRCVYFYSIYMYIGWQRCVYFYSIYIEWLRCVYFYNGWLILKWETNDMCYILQYLHPGTSPTVGEGWRRCRQNGGELSPQITGRLWRHWKIQWFLPVCTILLLIPTYWFKNLYSIRKYVNNKNNLIWNQLPFFYLEVL